MRIALINTPSLTTRPVSRSMAGGLGFDGGAHLLLPPLDLASMAATLRNGGETVVLIDADPLGLDVAGVYAMLDGERWDVLLATVSLPTLEADARFLAGLATRHPAAKVIAKTLIRDQEVLAALLERSGAALVIHGEADLSIGDIVHGRETGGTAWREPAGQGEPPCLRFDSGEPVADLDALPLPARDLLPNDRYVYPLLGTPVATVQTSRGCPYPCGFYCPYPLVEGTKWRHQSPERVMTELRTIVEELGITKIYFRDATFTLNQSRIERLCDLIVAAGWKIEWTCETRVDCLGDAVLEKMRAAGCVGVLIGVESGDEEVMHHREGKKGLTVPRLAHLRAKARELGIKLHFLLIVGLPRETRRSIVDTYDLIRRYEPDTIGVTIITPYPGTPLHEQARAAGWIESFDWQRYGGPNVGMHTPHLAREDLVIGKQFLDEGFALLQKRQIGGRSRPLEAMAAEHYAKLLRWAYELDDPIAALQRAAAARPGTPAGVPRQSAPATAPMPKVSATTEPARVAAATLAPSTAAESERDGADPPRPAISIVIPTYDRRAILRKTLLGFASQTIPPETFEVIVVDDGSSDDTVAMVRRWSTGFRIEVIAQAHGGANAARNAGIRAARADLVLITGDDMVPGPAFLETHLKFHERHPDARDAALGFIDWSPELTVTPFMRYIVAPEGGQQFAFARLGDGLATHHYFYTSNVSLKRALLAAQPTLFDTDFTYPAYDDTELGYRLMRDGMRLHYVPQAVTYHHHEMTVTGFAHRQRMAGRMGVVFARKCPELAVDLGIDEAASLDAPARERQQRQLLDAVAELEKPDLSKLATLGVNGEDAASFFQRVFLYPCYAEILRSAYQLGIHEARRDQPAIVPTTVAASACAYDVSIIVPVFNRVDLTVQCFTALAEVTRGYSFELIVVDNASSDGTGDFLAQLNGDVQVIRNRDNLGFAKACNQGARAARGRHLLFLNNDTVPLAGWLEPMVEELDGHPEVEIVGSKLLYEDGSVQHAGVAFSRVGFGPYHIYRGSPGDSWVVNQRREYQCVTAACMLIRRETFIAVGGFDEGYVNGFEDVDLCLKVGARGGRIVYQPRSSLYHLESKTPGRHTHELENGRRLFARWGREWSLADEDEFYVADGFALRVNEQGGARQGTLEALVEPAARTSWQLVAESQRVARATDRLALRALLTRGSEWPDDVYVLRWAVELCERSGNDEYAAGFWSKLVRLGDALNGRRSLAEAALLRQDLDHASAHLDALLTRAPSDPVGWLLKGHLAVRRGQPSDARYAFETAARHGCDAGVVQAGLASLASGADARAGVSA